MNSWYIILGENKLSQVYYDDGTGETSLIDDLAYLEKSVWDQVRISGYLRIKEYEFHI